VGSASFFRQVADASFKLPSVGIVTVSPLEMQQKIVTVAWLNRTKDCKGYFVTITNSKNIVTLTAVTIGK
jgi:hypothetical protein